MASQRLPNVALAGATGSLGRPVLESLLQHGYSVTVLSRVSSNNSLAIATQRPHLSICKVDLTSADSITPALAEYKIEVVISCLATLAIGAQNPLIDAPARAGVSRFTLRNSAWTR